MLDTFHLSSACYTNCETFEWTHVLTEEVYPEKDTRKIEVRLLDWLGLQ